MTLRFHQFLTMILDEEFYSGPIEAGIGDKTASVKVN